MDDQTNRPQAPKNRAVKPMSSVTRGVNREYMGSYIPLNIDVQHRALEQIMKRYDAYDGAMQYIFGFVPQHIRKAALVKKWGDDMDAFLKSAIDWMTPQIDEFESVLTAKNLQHAQVRSPKPFAVGSQTPYSTFLIQVIQTADRMLMLLDALWLYRLTEADHKNSVQSTCIKLLGNIMNEARNMQAAARRELDEHNRKLAEKKAEQSRLEGDIPPSAVVDQLAQEKAPTVTDVPPEVESAEAA